MHMSRSDHRALTIFSVMFLAAVVTFMLDRLFLGDSVPTLAIDTLYMDSMDAFLDEMGDSGASQRDGQASYERMLSSFSKPVAVHPRQVESFDFDPNTADSIQFLKLGLAVWQVHSIYKYRALGGRYHRVEEFKRVPGMTPELYERLSPHIKIAEKFKYYSDLGVRDGRDGHDRAKAYNSGDAAYSSKEGVADVSNPPRQEKFQELVVLDLNTVDTSTLKRIPGIASYRARRIVDYRERLGGYVSVDQLSELNGDIPEELKVWFAVDSAILRPLHVNTDDSRTLSRHPYLSYVQARAIIQYRKNYGRISSLADLSLLDGFTDADLQRLAPYVVF